MIHTHPDCKRCDTNKSVDILSKLWLPQSAGPYTASYQWRSRGQTSKTGDSTAAKLDRHSSSSGNTVDTLKIFLVPRLRHGLESFWFFSRERFHKYGGCRESVIVNKRSFSNPKFWSDIRQNIDFYHLSLTERFDFPSPLSKLFGNSFGVWKKLIIERLSSLEW